MKTIDTLVDDILEVVEGLGGWDEAASEYLSGKLSDTVTRKLKREEEEVERTLRFSSLGHPCMRKHWLSVNIKDTTYVDSIPSTTKLMFLYGDIIEDLILSLAKAAGHTVEGEQDEMSILGIKGHRDCVIDGHLVDVKSANSWSFKKFKENKLREDDSFGYISQLSSYLYASKDDPLVKDKTKASFLVVDKVFGNLCLDTYDLTAELATKEEEVQKRIDAVESTTPPPIPFSPEREMKGRAPDKKATGNSLLPVNCKYCPFKRVCWEGLRTFQYATGNKVVYTDCPNPPRLTELT